MESSFFISLHWKLILHEQNFHMASNIDFAIWCAMIGNCKRFERKWGHERTSIITIPFHLIALLIYQSSNDKVAEKPEFFYVCLWSLFKSSKIISIIIWFLRFKILRTFMMPTQYVACVPEEKRNQWKRKMRVSLRSICLSVSGATKNNPKKKRKTNKGCRKWRWNEPQICLEEKAAVAAPIQISFILISL